MGGQPLDQPVDRWRIGHRPAERRRRHAEAVGHADAVDPAELTELRALAADEADQRPVDLLEPDHEITHEGE